MESLWKYFLIAPPDKGVKYTHWEKVQKFLTWWIKSCIYVWHLVFSTWKYRKAVFNIERAKAGITIDIRLIKSEKINKKIFEKYFSRTSIAIFFNWVKQTSMYFIFIGHFVTFCTKRNRKYFKGNLIDTSSKLHFTKIIKIRK